jgi:hypothetical protein
MTRDTCSHRLRPPLPTIPHNIRYVNYAGDALSNALLLSLLSEVAIAQRTCQTICHCSAKLLSPACDCTALLAVTPARS